VWDREGVVRRSSRFYIAGRECTRTRR
jgi:hypothetical protein